VSSYGRENLLWSQARKKKGARILSRRKEEHPFSLVEGSSHKGGEFGQKKKG